MHVDLQISEYVWSMSLPVGPAQQTRENSRKYLGRPRSQGGCHAYLLHKVFPGLWVTIFKCMARCLLLCAADISAVRPVFARVVGQQIQEFSQRAMKANASPQSEDPG